MLFDFGASTDGIIQTAFVVQDLDAAMEHFSARLGVGPWTTVRDAGPEGQTYRGQPAQTTTHVGFGFSGHMQYELIQPADDLPSVYRDVIEDRGYGFHHFGYATPKFEEAVAAMRDDGYEIAAAVEGSGLRIAYFDTRDILPGMTELIEATDAVNTFFSGMWRASVDAGAPPAAPPLVPGSPPHS